MGDAVEALVAEMFRLGMAGGAGVGLLLLVLLLGAITVLGARKLGSLPRDPPPEEPPASEWNTNPDVGAVVVPGPPGGTEEQNQSG